MGPTTSPLFFPFHTTFTPLYSFYTLKINGSHHFTHFSFSFPLLYTYFLTSVPNPFDKKWEGRREYHIKDEYRLGDPGLKVEAADYQK